MLSPLMDKGEGGVSQPLSWQVADRALAELVGVELCQIMSFRKSIEVVLFLAALGDVLCEQTLEMLME